MKVLIAYDGSECADAAIVDLKRAGLPRDVEALILSVGEYSPEANDRSYAAVSAGVGGYSPFGMDDSVTEEIPTAKSLALQAQDRLRADFPDWRIEIETWTDAPEKAIIRKAHEWKPDLIVIGSRGHSTVGRLVLGSVSQHVLHHAACSVRISRHHLHSQDRPIRLLLAFDGSAEAQAAIRSVAGRNWPANTEVRVVGVYDSQRYLSSVEVVSINAPGVAEGGKDLLAEAVHEAARGLTESGLRAAPVVLTGKPANALLEEAEKWGADCIFLGAKPHHGLGLVLMGSVSDAVAPRAHCSVEIVRPRADQ